MPTPAPNPTNEQLAAAESLRSLLATFSGGDELQFNDVNGIARVVRTNIPMRRQMAVGKLINDLSNDEELEPVVAALTAVFSGKSEGLLDGIRKVVSSTDDSVMDKLSELFEVAYPAVYAQMKDSAKSIIATYAEDRELKTEDAMAFLGYPACAPEALRAADLVSLEDMAVCIGGFFAAPLERVMDRLSKGD